MFTSVYSQDVTKIGFFNDVYNSTGTNSNTKTQSKLTGSNFKFTYLDPSGVSSNDLTGKFSYNNSLGVFVEYTGVIGKNSKDRGSTIAFLIITSSPIVDTFLLVVQGSESKITANNSTGYGLNSSGVTSDFATYVALQPSISSSGTITGVQYGTNASSLSYSSTTNSPTSYSIDWVSGITDVSQTNFSFNAGAGTLNINLGNNLPVGTYTGTLRIFNADGLFSDLPISVTITSKSLNIIGLTGVNKQYDGNNAASVSGTPSLNGIVSGDGANVILGGSPTFTFLTTDVRDGVTITVSGYTISGSASGNYTLIQPSLSANITSRLLSITANDDSKNFGETKTYGSGSTAFTSNGLQNGETIGTVTLSSIGAAASAAVGTYPIIASAATGGTFNANNYTINYINGTLTINPAAVTAPSNLYYSLSSYTTTYGTAGNTSNPTVSGSVPITYTITTTPISGVTVNENTGIVSYSSSVAAGSYSITIRASNSAGSTTATFSLIVNKAASTITVTGTQSYTYNTNAQGPSTSTVTGSVGA
ncbi:MAG: beta strand repeat-containing protein, partial [Bacteroidota bacterium]